MYKQLNDPTILPSHKGMVFEPKEEDKLNGIKACIPGGMNCPWCNSKMDAAFSGRKNKQSSGVVQCLKNSDHRVLWIPWGS